MGAMQNNVCFPVMHYYTRGDGFNSKASKRAVEKVLQPEKGFSEDIGKRNSTRNILSTLISNRDVVQLHNYDGPFASHDGISSSMSECQPKRVMCLEMSGRVLGDYFQVMQKSLLAGVVLRPDDLAELVDQVLSQVEINAFDFFSQAHVESLAALSPSAVLERKAAALALHQAVIATSTAHSQASRKKVQGRIRTAIKAYRDSRLERFSKRCESILEELSARHFNDEHRDHNITLTLELGESGNVYSQFLTFKNSSEKIVNAYAGLDIAHLLSEGETTAETQEGISTVDIQEALSAFVDEEVAEASTIKHNVLYEFIIKQIKHVLDLGKAWVQSYESVAAVAEEKTQTMESNTIRVQTELETLIRTAISEKEEAGVVIVGLMDTFQIAREEQTRIVDEKQSELDRLVAGLDRTTKLNETDKEDLTQELMKIQDSIQAAQHKSLELRQERENQTSTLHNDLLEDERKGHRWFRSTIAKQHALLSEELSLERQVNQTKSRHMEQMFAADSEHIRNLEKIRAAAQDQRQGFRDTMFRQRDKNMQAHESMMSALRERNMELDSKLATQQIKGSEKKEKDKGCVVM